MPKGEGTTWCSAPVARLETTPSTSSVASYRKWVSIRRSTASRCKVMVGSSGGYVRPFMRHLYHNELVVECKPMTRQMRHAPEPPADPRANQKQRTRQALVEAASAFVKAGQEPSL